MREIAKKLKISYNAVYYSLHRTAQTGSNQNRKRKAPGGPGAQMSKYIRVSSLRNRCLTSSQLAVSLNNTRKKSVSTSTVRRRLRDAWGFCGQRDVWEQMSVTDGKSQVTHLGHGTKGYGKLNRKIKAETI